MNQFAVVVVLSPSKDSLLPNERQWDGRIRCIYLAGKPVAVKHGFGDYARLDAVTNTKDLDLILAKGLGSLDQFLVESTS